MIIDHCGRVRKVSADQQQICDNVQAKSRGISDELINDLAISTLAPIEDVRAIADWTVINLKGELKQRNVKIQPNTIKPELLKMMIHSLVLERQRTGRLVQSSGDMSVDPPSAERAQPPKTLGNIKEMSDSFIIYHSDATGMSAIDSDHMSKGGLHLNWRMNKTERSLAQIRT